MTLNWTRWTEEIIRKHHGHIKTYRSLYEGDHAALFPRARRLIETGEITDQITNGSILAKQIQTPYVMANVCKMIVDVPALLVSRAVGQVTTTMNDDDFETPLIQTEDGPIDALDNQNEMIRGIVKRSRLATEHKTNIIHHQMDGGIVGVPYDGENGIRLEFKSRDVYYPHDDGLGCDLVYEITRGDDEEDLHEDERNLTHYLHVYRERVEDEVLHTEHQLYEISKGRRLERIEDEEEIREILGIDEIERDFPGRDRPFIVYWANDKTFMHPLGRSVLHNQAGKQDEINWTLTRNAIVYERNGKPRIAVSKEIFGALQDKAYERYGDEAKIDHRDLEITTFDANGKAMEIIQIDVTKIGDIKWAKDIMKIMLMETQTSEKAVDFFLEGGAAAQSGIAKFYDLFMSILKAEQITGEYIQFLQQLFENCLWIANQDDPNIIIEEPRIQVRDMMPIARKELIEQEGTAFKNGTQSLDTTIRHQNPNAPDDWIEEETEKIEEAGTSTDSTAIIQGRQSLGNLLDNRNPNGTPQGGASA